MSLDEVKAVKKDYVKKDNKLEKMLLNGHLSSTEFKKIEEEQIFVENTIDIIDDLLDAYSADDVDDISFLQEQLKECMVK